MLYGIPLRRYAEALAGDVDAVEAMLLALGEAAIPNRSDFRAAESIALDALLKLCTPLRRRWLAGEAP